MKEFDHKKVADLDLRAKFEIHEGVTRREFLKVAVVTSIAVGALGSRVWAIDPGERKGDMIYRTLGKTGERVSAIGLGGYHLGSAKDEKESVRILRSAVDHGITFMDNCWDYHDGKSEEWMGMGLRDGYRQKVFLMTKIDGRSKAGAARQIDESLKRLQTDHLDLLQFHEIIRMEDPEKVFQEGGAMEAVQDAKKAGKLRYIGFTGHKDPLIHLHMLETAKKHDFHFDAVQMPINVMDAQNAHSFENQVLPVLVKEQIGVLGMKSMGGGVILKSHTATPIECLHFALSRPTSVVITGMDKMEILNQALEAVRTFKPLTEEQVATLFSKTAEAAREGKYELFKTSTTFDGTAHHPEWLT
ncbi:aldo/keto reductase [Pedosphaera parvula]|uniref:Aldo/keto reductase n=1 Tax=Pedosphaera parvula (strain Ellin514) TaxID=320771 RepID=B9XQW9_PEDPL|nr:aldo/keto reductase [Pedosphaera parvula]EEF57746.1 aldo/keto reductase [Pedosphaera parvula Ellin514]